MEPVAQGLPDRSDLHPQLSDILDKGLMHYRVSLSMTPPAKVLRLLLHVHTARQIRTCIRLVDAIGSPLHSSFSLQPSHYLCYDLLTQDPQNS